ncbi:unnamed protein product, partial [Polarella glacialis]
AHAAGAVQAAGEADPEDARSLGWFSIHETNPDTYRQGKLTKLLDGLVVQIPCCHGACFFQHFVNLSAAPCLSSMEMRFWTISHARNTFQTTARWRTQHWGAAKAIGDQLESSVSHIFLLSSFRLFFAFAGGGAIHDGGFL